MQSLCPSKPKKPKPKSKLSYTAFKSSFSPTANLPQFGFAKEPWSTCNAFTWHIDFTTKKIEQIIFGDKMKLELHAEKTDIQGKGKDNPVTIRSKKGQKIDKETKDIS